MLPQTLPGIRIADALILMPPRERLRFNLITFSTVSVGSVVVGRVFGLGMPSTVIVGVIAGVLLAIEKN